MGAMIWLGSLFPFQCCCSVVNSFSLEVIVLETFSNHSHFCCLVFCFAESCSHQHRSISCWFITPMPFSMIKNTVMLHVNTAWHCNRRRSSAKHPKFEPLPAELRPTCKHRWGRQERGAGSSDAYCPVHIFNADISTTKPFLHVLT